MSIFFSNFHFLRPWWLLALVALPLIWRALSQSRAGAGAWRGVVDEHLLPHLLVRDEATSPSRSPRPLAACAFALSCLALAGPAWEQLPQQLYQNRSARVIALELSATMQAQDVTPSRFARARYKIADILQRTADGQSALIAYAGEPFVVAPLTDDVNTVSNLLDALEPTVMPVQGNNTGKAIDMAVSLIHGAGLHQGEVLLLADAVGDGADAAAERARSAGVRVSVIGVGSAQGAPVPLQQGGFLKNASGDIVLPKLDDDALTTLARDGGGSYTPISTDSSDLDRVLDLRSTNSGDTAIAKEVTTTRYLDRGPWLAILLLPLALLGFRRGWLMLLPLVLSFHAQPAAAFSWTDLWQRPDQQAQVQLDAGNAKQAQAIAQDPDLRGAAAYRAGDMADAAEDFSRRDDADAHYNAGNALAKQQRFKEALAAYNDALRRNPDMDDAKANKQAVQEWLKKQQQQNKNGGGDKKPQDAQDHLGKDQQDDGSSGSQGGDKKNQPSDKSSSSADEPQDSKQNQQTQNGQSSGDQKQDQSSSSSSGQQSDRGDDNGSQQQAGADKADAQAQKDFAQKMDKAVQKDKDAKKGQPIRLGANEHDSAQDERQQAVQQWLQRVPDDPGGLLRRKFLLEYQRRQQGPHAGDDSQ
ncbi:MAG TPA: VWA domain-containing protein [Rudaea sp.]|nr:VWA domain-containing protein [Rudaea sp.]